MTRNDPRKSSLNLFQTQPRLLLSIFYSVEKKRKREGKGLKGVERYVGNYMERSRNFSQEFDIEMTKVGGSLGFTLRKADSSALGHYVRALVREPALSDGRIRTGDKIVAVDGVPLSPMSHEEAVQLLRQCGPTVRLRLYRDLAQTPVSALSPTEPDHPLRPPRTSLR